MSSQKENRSDPTGDQRSKPTVKGQRERGERSAHTQPADNDKMPENVADLLLTPPNGGWGWVVVLCSLVGNLIVDGISYNFGVFLVEFVDTFKETKSKVSLVGSLNSGLYLFVGPVVSALTNTFGCRPIVVTGSIISGTAFILATFAPNIEVLIVTYGVIGGIGLGMIYLPCIVGVGHYFDTKRAFATGIAVCGSGLGTFVFPPLSEFLLTSYSWRGGLLIIAAIVFQGCVCGALMRPLRAAPRTTKTVSATLESGDSQRTGDKLSQNSEPVHHQLHRLSAPDNSQPATNKQAVVSPIDLIDLPLIDGVSSDQDLTDSKPSNRSDTIPSSIHELIPLLEIPAPSTHHRNSHEGHLPAHVSLDDLARPLYRQDIFYSGSVLALAQFRSQPDMPSYIASVTLIPGTSPHNRLLACLPLPVQDVLGQMLDVSLLKDLGFMFICLGNFTAFLGMYVPFVFLVDRAALLGIDRSRAAFLISVIGITNTAGRIVIGKVADLHVVDSLVMTYVALGVMGLTTCLVPLCNTYVLLATDAAVFGLGMAAYIALSSIVICDRMGVGKLTNAFGLLTLVRGSAAIAGPPVAGFMFDASGSYDLSFFIGGLLLIAGAGCMVLLHLPVFRQTTKVES